MAMRDLRDKQLDDDIRRVLKYETNLSAAQKSGAWERLHARAQAQTQLPPIDALVAPDETRPRWSWMLDALRTGSTRLLRTLVLDTAALERARAPKSLYPYPYYTLQARIIQSSMMAA